ncbi:MAG: hypothetical protein AB7O97_05375 [Planctomycetota bacterium]
MIGRYRIERGRALTALPPRVRRGHRQDTRKHTRHCLRPTAAMVDAMLASPPAQRAAAFAAFEREYLALLAARLRADRAPFDALRDLGLRGDVFLGCNCPTAKNPDVAHCHTVLALRFLQREYPELDIELPRAATPPRR